MRVLNDFECPEGHITEHFVDSEVTAVRCDCGLEAPKKLKAPMFKEKTTGKNVSGKALVRWGKKRDRQLKQERKGNSQE